jgi:hypothetical protein
MNDRPEARGRTAPCLGVLLALLLLALSPAPTPAAPPAATCPVHAEAPGQSGGLAAPAPFASLRSLFSEGNIWIQAVAVIGLIGIFWLTRAIK